MSSSPRLVQITLQNEIKKRINQNDLTKNDIEYYQRKLRRLQNEYNISQDQLIKLKVKLKRSQDFEYKHQILFKQFNDIKIQLERKSNEINDLQSINQQLKIKLEQALMKDKDYSLQKSNYLSQIFKWQSKYDTLIEKNKRDIENQKIRFEQKFRNQKQRLKIQYQQKQQNLQYQIRQLKKIVQQKQTVQDIINQRVEKIRKEKDQQIQRLKNIIEQKKSNYEEYVTNKDQQFQRMKEKFEKIINFDIQNLKNNLDDQQEIFSIELNGLRQMIALKNDQIQKLLIEIKRQAKQHDLNRKQLQKQITILKQKIYTIQKQAQIQLLNLKDRLIAIQKQDILTIQDRHQKIVDSLKLALQDTKRYINQLERLRQNDRLESQRMKSELNDRLKEKDKRIIQLGQNIKERGQLNASQMKNLHESFHKIQSQKEILTTEYQTNVVFLNQQIAKLSTSNQVKTAEIKKLNQQIYALRQSYQDRIRQFDVKIKKQRKNHQQERQQDRKQKQQLKQTIQNLQRQIKNRQRRYQRELQKVQRQKNKLKYMLEQSERDIQRLNKYIKQIDDNLKNQFKKNQLSTLDKDGLRRQIISELEKQKVQLQALKLMEVDQIKKKYQIHFAKLTTENQKLKTDLLNKTISFEGLQNQFKKLDYKNRNAEKLQRDKIKQYQTKMMTLNQQIFITQDLYKTFLQAKARAEQ